MQLYVCNINQMFAKHQKSKITEQGHFWNNGIKENCPVFKMVLSTFQRELCDTSACSNNRLNSVSQEIPSPDVLYIT